MTEGIRYLRRIFARYPGSDILANVLRRGECGGNGRVILLLVPVSKLSQ